MKFVKGQKVKCIKDHWNFKIETNVFYRVLGFSESFMYLKSIDGMSRSKIEYFRTVITSIDDIIPGMTLTHKFDGEVVVKEYANGKIWYKKEKEIMSSPVEYFEECLFKNCDEEYEVIKVFNIIDVVELYVDKRRNLIKMLMELEVSDWNLSDKFIAFSKDCVPNSMWEDRELFEELGFIEKYQMLNPNMRLKEKSSGSTYSIVLSGNSFQQIAIICNGDQNSEFLPFVYGFFDNALTLRDLNKKQGKSFEII